MPQELVARNPVENNFVTRFILGLAVVLGMVIGARIVATALVSLDVPLGEWIGTGIGVLAVFVIFAGLYRKYDASFDSS